MLNKNVIWPLLLIGVAVPAPLYTWAIVWLLLH